MSDILRLSFERFTDPDTGAWVTRLTPLEQSAYRNYFYQKAFTADGRLLLGLRGDEGPQFWLLDLTSREARRITSGPGVNIQGGCLSADDRWLYFTRSRRRHVRVSLESTREEVVYEAPAGWEAYGTWGTDATTTRAAGLLLRAADRVTEGDGWERFTRQYEARPLMRLLTLDLETGRAQTVLEERRFLGHPLFRPHHELLSFCHEGPHDRVHERLWVIRPDGRGLAAAGTQLAGEAVTHEFWSADGARLLHVRYRRGQTSRSIGAWDPATGACEVLMPMPPCAHLMGDAGGRFLVGDGAGSTGDVGDPAFRGEPDPFLYLFDLETRTHRRLCGHRSSWKVYEGNTQASHPHPSFAPDGRVLFASDFQGALALYLAEP